MDAFLITMINGEASRFRHFVGVLDETHYGDEAVGLEILDLKRQLNLEMLPDPPSRDSYPVWFYDAEIDAFYIRLNNGRSQMQRTVEGVAGLDQDGCLLSFRVTTFGVRS